MPVQKDVIETKKQRFEVPVLATLGTLYKVRNDRGYYEAKVRPLALSTTKKQDSAEFLGAERDDDGNIIEAGAWIRFGERAEELVMKWQPKEGDRVIVYTLDNYGWESGWIYRMATSYDDDASAAADFQLSGPASVFSGKGSTF